LIESFRGAPRTSKIIFRLQKFQSYPKVKGGPHGAAFLLSPRGVGLSPVTVSRGAPQFYTLGFAEMQDILSENDQAIKAFVLSISKPRLTKYLQTSDGDIRKALQIYKWNTMLSQSLYFPLQYWEITLRNKLNDYLLFKYGQNWHMSEVANRNFIGQDQKRIAEVVARLSIGTGATRPTTDQVVAELSAGFWVSQFAKRYDAHYNWRNNLRFRIFLNEPSLTRENVHRTCLSLLELRNRVAHHEPIFHLDLNSHKDHLTTLLRGMCLVTNNYVSTNCSFARIWAIRPQA
jgi:hypothetical protein